MEGEIIEAFEYKGQTILLCLEEEKNEPKWLMMRVFYLNGQPVDERAYHVRKSDRLAALLKKREDPVTVLAQSVRRDFEKREGKTPLKLLQEMKHREGDRVEAKLLECSIVRLRVKEKLEAAWKGSGFSDYQFILDSCLIFCLNKDIQFLILLR